MVPFNEDDDRLSSVNNFIIWLAIVLMVVSTKLNYRLILDYERKIRYLALAFLFRV